MFMKEGEKEAKEEDKLWYRRNVYEGGEGEEKGGGHRRNVYKGEEKGGNGGGQAVVSRSVRSLGKVSGPGFTALQGENGGRGRNGGGGQKVFHTKLTG